MTRIQLALVVCAALALSACSGGGGCGGGGTPAATQVASTETIYSTQGTNILKKLISYYTDGTQNASDAVGGPQGTPTVGPDHVTVTGTYAFAATGNASLNGVIIEPSITTVPVLTPANYASNWTTTGTVTKPSVTGAGERLMRQGRDMPIISIKAIDGTRCHNQPLSSEHCYPPARPRVPLQRLLPVDVGRRLVHLPPMSSTPGTRVGPAKASM